MADNVINTQTNYPTNPDTSLNAYYNAMGYRTNGARKSAISRWWRSTFGPDPTYNQWRNEQWDQYNAKVNQFSSWMGSLSGQKAQAVEAGYNPAWLGSDPGGSASPLDYQVAQDPGENPAGDLLQGINVFMSLASGVQNIRKAALQNQLLGQEINSAAWDNVLKGAQAKYADRFFGYRAFKLGFESDWVKLLYGNEINSRLRGSVFDGSEFPEYTAPSLMNFYSIGPDYRKGFSYQNAFNESEIQKWTNQWRMYQSQLAHWSAEEKKYYYDNIQPVLKEWWEGRKTYQDTVNQLYEDETRNEMNNRTAKTVISSILGVLALVSKFIPGVPAAVPETLETIVNGTTGETTTKHKQQIK